MRACVYKCNVWFYCKQFGIIIIKDNINEINIGFRRAKKMI